MITRLRFLVASLAALCAIFASTSLQAQPTWGLVSSGRFPAPDGYISSIWATDPQIVLIGWHWNITTNHNGMVMRTTDGGASWTNCAIGPGISTNTAPIVTDIWFLTPDSGWMTVSGSLQSGDRWLWRTVDSGRTWTAINFDFGGGTSGLASVWQTDSTLVVTENLGNQVWYSKDTGKTWYNHPTLEENGLAFDHLLGVASAWNEAGSTTFLTSSDGGVNWLNANAGPHHEGWGVHWIPTASAFIAAPEDTTIFGVYQKSHVYRSTDYGRDWSTITTLPINTTGDVEGVEGILYVQSSGGVAGANPIDNMMESTDAGLTWFGAGGQVPSQVPSGSPLYMRDSRFAVTGCGNIVYVADDAAGLWKTLDAPGLKFIDSNLMRPITATICDTTKQLYFLHNINSSAIVINDIRILDSNRIPAKSHAVWLDSLFDPYESIQPGDSIAFKLAWHPGAMMDSSGIDSATIRIIYYASYLGPCSEMKLAYDTIVMHVKLIGLSTLPDYALSAAKIKTDTLAACLKVDTMVTLTNFGCDTLTLTQAQLAKNNWSLTDASGNPLKLPIRIPGGDSIRLRLRATPTSTALLFDSLEAKMHYEGHDTLWGVPLRTWAKLGTGPLGTPAALAFDSLATCDSSDEFLTLTNTGCDTLNITSLSGLNSIFEIFDTNGKPLPKPLAIPQDSSRKVLIRFIPGSLGGKSASLKMVYSYLGFDSSNVVSLMGTGASSGTLAFPGTMNFGPVSICQPQVDTISFHNTSCDSAYVENLILSGPFILLDSSELPVGVSSGKTLYLRVRYVPQAKGPAPGTAWLRAWTNNGQTGISDTIILTGTGISGTSVFSTDPDLTNTTLAFATRTQCDHTDSVSFYIHNTGCDTLMVTALALDPSIASVFAAHAGEPLPAAIPGGDSLRVTVGIVNLLAGNYNGNLHIDYTNADGTKVDSTIPAAVAINPGSGGQTVLNLRSATPEDFGQIQACSNATDTIILVTYDGGCGTIVLHDSISGTGFRIAGPDSILLSPGDTAKIPVYYDDSSKGNFSSTVHLTSAAWNTPFDVALTGNVAPADSVHFHLVFSSMPVAAGQIFSASLVPDLKVSGRGLHTIHGSFVWRRDNFEVGQATMTAETGLTLNQGGPIDNGTISRYNFDVTSAGDLALDPAIPIVTLPMTAMISDTPAGLIAIDSLRLNQSDPTFSLCELASDGLASATSLLIECGDSALIHYLDRTPIVLAVRPNPDPVTSENGYQTTIDITAQEGGSAIVVLYDGLGREISRGSIVLAHGITQAYTFDLHAQPAGSYHYQLLFTASSNSGRADSSGAMGNMLLLK